MRREYPLVTVLMPVYNGQDFLCDSLHSILKQSYKNLEVLIIDDGSTDESATIIRSFKDPRIRLEQHERNLGIAAALNQGLKLAKGSYIARMDCDDISEPNRVTVQVNFMEKHPKVGICGTWAREMGNRNAIHVFPQDFEGIKARLLFGSPLAHPTVMLRRAMIEEHELCYDPQALHAEDYELWARAAEFFPLANIPKPLLQYRVHGRQISSEFLAQQRNTTVSIQQRQLKRINLNRTLEDLQILNDILREDLTLFVDSLLRVNAFFVDLKNRNHQQQYCSDSSLKKELSERYYRLTYNAIVAVSDPKTSKQMLDTGRQILSWTKRVKLQIISLRSEYGR